MFKKLISKFNFKIKIHLGMVKGSAVKIIFNIKGMNIVFDVVCITNNTIFFTHAVPPEGNIANLELQNSVDLQ